MSIYADSEEGLEELIKRIGLVKPLIESRVRRRINEFLTMKNRGNEKWFSELCFCILTANSSARMGIRIQNELGYEGFSKLDRKILSKRLKELGYRFYNRRAEFIVEARKYLNLKDLLLKEHDKREWLVRNVKGIGYKEASHFLRNVGFLNYAILDRHILRILHNSGVVEMPKNLSKAKYIRIEKVFNEIAEKVGMYPGELDLYLWYLSTGEVLK
jgi:N-glycosylase/DNA lyase